MQYRTFGEPDYPALQALDLATQRRSQPDYDALPEREREARGHTSLSALKFYERSEHSFVAARNDEQGGDICGFILAQSVWQGDKPLVLVRTLSVSPDLSDTERDDITRGLMHATVKSAYDSAVYEVHFPVTPETQAAAQAEEAHLTGHYGVVHLGTRAQTAPGEKLSK